jgi:translation initiation factor 6 (eIF-6)
MAEKNTSNNIQNRVPHVLAWNIIELLLRMQNEIGNMLKKNQHSILYSLVVYQDTTIKM